MTVIHIFSDVSYEPILQIGVMGFIIIDKIKQTKHIQLLHMDNIKNTQLEKESIEIALNYVGNNISLISKIIVYTDCQGTFDTHYPNNVELVKIKAHKKKVDCNELEMQFREIDIIVRKEMRKRRKLILN